jgi:hypothetical protein
MNNKYEYLETLLSKIEMTQYMDLFIKNDLIEEDVIKQLSENDLEKIGITSLGNRKKILGVISKPIETENKEEEEDTINEETSEGETEEKTGSPWKVVGWLLVVLLIIVIIASIGI